MEGDKDTYIGACLCSGEGAIIRVVVDSEVVVVGQRGRWRELHGRHEETWAAAKRPWTWSAGHKHRENPSLWFTTPPLPC